VKIKNLFTGVVSNERADIARALIRQGLCEALEADTNAPEGEGVSKLPPKFNAANFVKLDPAWEVTVLGDHDQKVLAIRMTLGRAVYNYTGQPEHANAKAVWDGGGRYVNGFGREIPESILKLYTEQWNDNPNHRDPYGEVKPGPHAGNETMKSMLDAANYHLRTGQVAHNPVSKVVGAAVGLAQSLGILPRLD
jgi:hypothetical protein